ncbi:hypothetical protein [Fusobacterium mortiferum]|jgi:hypothetical protein|uniref:Uncharacterized protein n=1 Tax=Fusobacterium mortiferum TaxID=850 RepID=A0ABS2FZ37_FUSMR|nr:hypothetical protein [Fusobacterium mortiferum]MBM6874411.1 hypothetical protein [Fusobacterium mortiferum]
MKKNRNRNRELLILDRTKKMVLKNSISFLNEVKEGKRKFYNGKNAETFWDFQIAVAKCLIIYKKRIIKHKYSCISKKRIKKQKGIKLKNNYYSTQGKLTNFFIDRTIEFINKNSK